MRLVVLFLLLSVTTAYGEAGPSFLGICSPSWNCKETLRYYKTQDTIVTGWLENTFSSSCKCGDAILQLPQPKVARWHIANGPCLRNRRCGPYEVFAGLSVERANRKIERGDALLLKKFTAVTLRLKQRIESAKGGLTCYVSPCLECDFRDAGRTILANIVRDHLPACVIVDNPHGRKCKRGSVCEGHGDTPKLSKPCIADLDGKDGKVVDLRAYRRRTVSCDLRYYWEPWFNCIRSAKFIDPRKRDCSYDRKRFKEMKEKVWRLS